MADEKFHFSSGKILMKESNSFSFFFSGRKDIVHDGKLFCLKKSGKKKCEILSQWHLNQNRIKETVWKCYVQIKEPQFMDRGGHSTVVSLHYTYYCLWTSIT